MSGIDTINRLRKIDDAPADGLLGVSGSLSYEVTEVERHNHNRERWWGAVAVPDETNAIDSIWNDSVQFNKFREILIG